jgi:hypothetical protein
MGERQEPLIGWRIWRLRSDVLRSWAATYSWSPGENRARCLATLRRPCASSPGRECECGIWGLFRPLMSLERARSDGGEHASVVGLIRAWGELAIHGQEGFRAEKAAVACLFTDWVWEPVSQVQGGEPPDDGRLRRWFRRLFVPEVDPTRLPRLEAAAARYGVPLLSLGDAIETGLLEEFGVEADARQELREWLRMPPDRPTDHHST